MLGEPRVDGLLLNGQNVNFLVSKHLLDPLDSVIDQADFQPAALSAFRNGDKLYAAGTGSLNTSMMAVNQDLVQKYGLVVPTTFADIQADVAKLKGTGISLFGFGGATTFQWPLWFMQMLQQTSGDKPIDLTHDTLTTGSPKFTSSVYVRAMDLMRQLGASGAFEPGLIGTANTAAQANFVAGKYVLYYFGSWIISQLVAQSKFSVGSAPFPSFVDGTTARPTGGVTGAVAMYAHVPANKQALARKFVQFVTSPAGCAKQIAVAPQGFSVPATRNTPVGKQTALDREVLTDYTPRSFTFLDWYWPAGVTTAFQQAIQAVVGQQSSPQSAMKNVQLAFEESL